MRLNVVAVAVVVAVVGLPHLIKCNNNLVIFNLCFTCASFLLFSFFTLPFAIVFFVGFFLLHFHLSEVRFSLVWPLNLSVLLTRSHTLRNRSAS